MCECQLLSQPELKILHAKLGFLLAEYVKVELQAAIDFIIVYCINSNATVEHAVRYSDFINIKS